MKNEELNQDLEEKIILRRNKKPRAFAKMIHHKRPDGDTYVFGIFEEVQNESKKTKKESNRS